MLKKFLFNKLKRSSLKKVPFKKKKRVVDYEGIEKMRAFFMSLWKSRPHYCTICGVWLGNEPHSYHFDHLLEKSKYPEFKYLDINICLLCLECHDCRSRGIYPGSYAIKIEEVRKKLVDGISLSDLTIKDV